MISETRTTAPTEKPVLLEELQDHLRIDGADDEAYLHTLLEAATDYAEDALNRALVTQTWTRYLDRFPAVPIIELDHAPLQSVTSIKYTPNGGSPTTFSSDNYIVDTGSDPGRVVLARNVQWPSSVLQAAKGVEIIYVAGFGTRNAVPEWAKQLIKMICSNWYFHRDAVLTGTISKVSDMAAQSLINAHRIYT